MAAINAISIAGIRIRVDQSWFIAFFLFSWTLSLAYFPLQVPDYPPFTYWVAGTLSSLGLFACVLLHELSHCLVARHLGVEVRQITLFIFGGVSEMAQTNSSSPVTEFHTTIAGPLSSLGLGVIFVTAGYFIADSPHRMIVEMIRYLFYVNFLLAAFNLIPGFPLDGGRVLRAYLWHRSGNLQRATRSAARVGVIFAVTVICIGVVAALNTHIIPGVWLVLIGLFLKNSAERERRSFELRFGLQDLKVREIMTPLETAKAVAADYLFDSSTYCNLDPDTDATDALQILVTQNCSKACVVRDGILVGILTRSDLFKLISLKQDIAA